MEGRLIEYRPIGGGLDYHHNSPLIGEIPPSGGDYSHAVHRSIDHLRNSLNERVALGPLSCHSSHNSSSNNNSSSSHIVVTSNSVDNGGIRMQNATINERNPNSNPNTNSNPIPTAVSGSVANASGISSSTSSPHHMPHDVKDNKVKASGYPQYKEIHLGQTVVNIDKNFDLYSS
ncbi:uncharacterized protein Dvir_GJ26829 [Drosophila virilis]|uniref:Uncharacterized protein n=1 Tax=Drosophila virilis TaxID=7244 RepID=A0A0Q9W1C4_DROVI|nr:uncharacterized protein Dvir_GJ26829 [Drosophila virilis]